MQEEGWESIQQHTRGGSEEEEKGNVQVKNNRGGQKDVMREWRDWKGEAGFWRRKKKNRMRRKEERRVEEEGGGDESSRRGDKRREMGCGAAAENMKNTLQGSCCIQIFAIKI